MSIDDVSNPFHAAELERGEDPRKDTAQFRLARLLAEHDDVHTIHHQMIVAGRVLAFLPRLNGWVDAEQQPGKRSPQLRQQQTASLSDVDWLEEECFELARELDVKQRMLAEAKARRVPDFDPDHAGERDDDRRLSQAARDDAATADAPRVAS